VLMWTGLFGGFEVMSLEFRDWKLLRCLTAVAPQLRHSSVGRKPQRSSSYKSFT
jgi:hypothetical protein